MSVSMESKLAEKVMRSDQSFAVFLSKRDLLGL
jgi:hypothetical protein